MTPVRLGIVGCGVIGQFHAKACAAWPTVKLTALSDLRPEPLAKMAAEFGVTRTHAQGEQLIADPEVDALVLAMPTHIRTGLALKALAAGKHVLLEKPVAMHSDEVKRLMAARGNRVVACCSSRHRFSEPARVATALLERGGLGPIRVVRVRAIGTAGAAPSADAPPPPPWRVSKALNGGGFLVNWGCYDLDYLLGLNGWRLKPRTVLAQTWTAAPMYRDRQAPGSDAETHYAVLIRCDGGEVITMERGELVPAARDIAWQIIGQDGSLRLDMLAGDKCQIIHDRGDPGKGVVTETLWEGPIGWSMFHDGPVRDFADAIAHGRRPTTGLEESLTIQKVTDAVYESSDTGRAVTIHD